MRRLSKVVNIVPVIAKADTLTLEERDFFKKKVKKKPNIYCVCVCVYTMLLVLSYSITHFFMYINLYKMIFRRNLCH